MNHSINKQFLDYWKINGPESLLGYTKSGQLYFELMGVKDLEGNTAEIGVYKGYTSKINSYIYTRQDTLLL